jgi:WD40 repeat protein
MTKSGATKSSTGEFEHLNNSSSLGKSVNYGSLSNMRWTAPVVLIKHTDEITGIQLSTAFKVVVSIGRDGVIAIWDMNRLG